MSSRILPLLAVLCLVFVSCSPDEEAVTTTTTIPTTTTTEPTTTTTEPTTTTTEPVVIEGAPEELTALVRAFYLFASGQTPAAPTLPVELLATVPRVEVDYPHSGTAAVGTFLEQSVATIEMEGDLFLAVDDGSGWQIVGGSWPSLSMPAYFGGAPRHVAVVGSDARPGEDPAQTRADSIHFVALDGNGAGAIVGLPRDSWVTVPGRGNTKVNSALAIGGPESMMATFNQLTGLPLEGYVLTGFAGFESLLSSVLGGVTVNVPFSINDQWAHVSLGAGEQLLNGAQALGFARARKTVPGGDFTRSEHQGVILIAAARAAKEMGYLALPQLLEKSQPHFTTDLTPEQLLTFSAMVMAADPGSMTNVVAPGSPGSAGGASVVFLSSSVSALWTDLGDGVLGN